jgi:hypothetical protein
MDGHPVTSDSLIESEREMPDLPYASKVRHGAASFAAGEEARIERIYINALQREEIRFSWWRHGQFMLRPLDVTEDELLVLFKNTIQAGVFSETFLSELSELLQSRPR